MTFTSLMRKSPSVTPKARLSVDEFIDQANYYAMGQAHPKLVAVEGGAASASGHEPMKTTSFRLTEEARDKLDALSERTGLSRSRLVRIWLGQLDPEADYTCYSASIIR